MITEIISKLKQGFEELEKGEAEKSKQLFEEVLQKDSKNGQAYAGLLLIEKGLSKLSELETLEEPFDSSENYKKAMLYGGKDLTVALDHCLILINKRNAKKAKEFEAKKNAEEKAKALEEEKRKADEIKNRKSPWQKNAEKEQELLASSLRNKTQKKKKNKKVFTFVLAFILAFSSVSALIFLKINHEKKREKAISLLYDGKYVEAYHALKELGESTILLENNAALYALSLANDGNYEKAIELLVLTNKKDSFLFEAFQNVLAGDYKKAVNSGLTSLTLPVGITHIPDEAFCDCTAIEKIVIPEGVTKIGAFAFEGCTSLKEVVLPSSMKTISENSFLGCSSLTEILIPKDVTTIGRNAFSKCNLSKAVFQDGNNWTVDNVSYFIKDEAQTAKDISINYTGTWEKIK
ncbi:MAG: leucine-rich repeat domain-containing protein [Ruminococcaceae bacterium]|nr:leucine-rich repeat domain-containing protein [Oscillospiraceae bacterium]